MDIFVHEENLQLKLGIKANYVSITALLSYVLEMAGVIQSVDRGYLFRMEVFGNVLIIYLT